MKHFETIILAVAAAAVLASCETLDSSSIHNFDPDSENSELAEGQQKCNLTIYPAIDGATKATGVAGDKTDENKINNTQVVIFNGDNIVCYSRSTKDNSIGLSIIAGTRDIVLLINAPSFESEVMAGTIASKEALLSKVSSLEDSGFANLLMVGDTTVTVSGNMTIPIVVKHLVARIHVKKVTRCCTIASMQQTDMTLKSIYVVNAAGNITYGGASNYNVMTWYNRDESVSEDSLKLGKMIFDSVNLVMKDDTEYNTGHYFYVYPNDSDESGLSTLLVFETEVRGTTFYYPVEMPALESNKSYEIDNVILSSTGGDTPSEPVEWDAIELHYSVKPWTEVVYDEIEV